MEWTFHQSKVLEAIRKLCSKYKFLFQVGAHDDQWGIKPDIIIHRRNTDKEKQISQTWAEFVN